MNTTFIRTAAILGALAVVLGAFGAHSLEKVLEPKSLQAFETGVRYQFYHALALLAAGMLAERYHTLWAGRFLLPVSLHSPVRFTCLPQDRSPVSNRWYGLVRLLHWADFALLPAGSRWRGPSLHPNLNDPF